MTSVKCLLLEPDLPHGTMLGNRPFGRAVTRSSLEREGLRFKWDTVLPTARHRCDISSKEAVLPLGAMTRRWDPPTHYTLRVIQRV